MKTSLTIRMGLAVRQLDSDMARQSRGLCKELPLTHPAFFAGWEFPLRHRNDVLVRYEPDELAGLGMLERQLELNRCHAEARLAEARAGLVHPAPDEEERLLRRAMGLLPGREDERLLEAASCPVLEPHYLTSRPERFAEGITEVEAVLGQATAVLYAFLLMAGVRTNDDLCKYGSRLQQLFDDVVDHPGVLGRLERAATDHGLAHDERVRMVYAVRERLWVRRRGQVGRFITLTQVIDALLGGGGPLAGDDLGLVLVDAIVLGKLGFPVHFLIRQGRVYLQVVVGMKGVETWDPLDWGARVPVGTTRRLGLVDLALEGYLRMARGYSSVSSFGHGERVARWILALKPESADAHEVLGVCLLGLQRPREAIDEADYALRLNPLLADSHLLKGNALAMLGEWEPAIASYKQAINRRTGFAEAYNNLGIALARGGHVELAVGAYSQATRIKPDYVEAYYNLGNLYLEREEYRLAIESYRHAVEHRPSFAGALYNLGQARYRLGELVGARDAYLAAVQANPKHAGAWHNLGIVYRDLGEPEKAVEAIEQAVKINPTLFR
ncbi:tetratricopeptide repeat protein [candidate division WOR-3 bacterium]|nr:tetratricopeptide repeat protein [candidate division WOR-3 bacterium]